MRQEDTPTRSTLFVRNIMLGSLLETLLVASVVSVLTIRFYLTLTGFPQVGTAGLHIAHMLWGGLLMLIAIILLLAFLGRRLQFIAALLGGIGFGTFIDELGKFITSDNNYFFQPTIALIYIIFVILFLCLRTLEQRSHFSEQAVLANALDVVKEGVLHNLRVEDKSKILSLLRTSDSHDPRLSILAEMIERMDVAPSPKPSVLGKISMAIRSFYRRQVQSQRFSRLLMTSFICYALLFALFLLELVNIASRDFPTQFTYICLLVSLVLSSVMIVIGVLLLHRSRLKAYLWFKRAVLVSILLGQVFLFYTQEMGALSELALNLIVLATLNFMIHTEQGHIEHKVQRA